MHAPVLIISDWRPDADADALVNQGDFDYLQWAGDGTFDCDSSWADGLKRYLLQEKPDKNVDDSQFVERYGAKGLGAAPRLSQVDLERILLDDASSYLVVDGSLHKRKDWCVAHRQMEEDKAFVQDVLHSVGAYLKHHDAGPDPARVWVYDAHL